MPNPSWSPNASIPPFGLIVDSNGNVQVADEAGGITGLNQPSPWGQNVGDTTPDNDILWTCEAVFVQPGPAVAGLPATPPLFLTDADGLSVPSIVADMIAQFEAESGRTLFPAQVERVYINFSAFRESLVRFAIQYTGQQNLLAFSAFPVIDFLGGLLGVTRLPSQPATVVIQFILANVLTVPLTIPAGTPVGSQDGQVVFLTDSDLTIPAGNANGTVNATCQSPGAIGNGYTAGNINVPLAPNALIATVQNTVTSNGGSPFETDNHLRTRIQAAPNRFSNAGPAKAYRFFALGVDPSIGDAQVVSSAPGVVDVYVLLGPATEPAAGPNATGIAGSPVLDAVAAALNADDIRPLTDTVNVHPVTEVDYQISATVTLYNDADPDATEAAVATAAQQFVDNLSARIQRDIVPEEIIAALTVPGVYRVVLTNPAYIQLTAGQWANCTLVTITFATATEGI